MESEKSEKQKRNDEQNTFDIPKIVGIALRKCHHTNDARQIAQKAYKLTVEERAALLKFFDCKAADLVFEIKKFWLGANLLVQTEKSFAEGVDS